MASPQVSSSTSFLSPKPFHLRRRFPHHHRHRHQFVSKLEEKKPSEKGVLVPNAKQDEKPDISHFEFSSLLLLLLSSFFLLS
ncbi:hypothetical protein NC651_029421 [Populus alba x Populus x berolinensis]|nr:hypothetical protein NC651_029421 [Populus alba x Populus x berolinensis]